MASPQDSQLQLVGVGLRAVWAVTRDHRVWFRRGLGGAAGGQDDSNDKDTGTAWLLMVGSLSLITLGPNDQVRKESGVVMRWGRGSSIYVHFMSLSTVVLKLLEYFTEVIFLTAHLYDDA